MKTNACFHFVRMHIVFLYKSMHAGFNVIGAVIHCTRLALLLRFLRLFDIFLCYILLEIILYTRLY